MSVGNDFLTLAAQQQSTQPSPAARSHHNKIIAARISNNENSLRRWAFQDFSLLFAGNTPNPLECRF